MAWRWWLRWWFRRLRNGKSFEICGSLFSRRSHPDHERQVDPSPKIVYRSIPTFAIPLERREASVSYGVTKGNYFTFSFNISIEWWIEFREFQQWRLNFHHPPFLTKFIVLIFLWDFLTWNLNILMYIRNTRRNWCRYTNNPRRRWKTKRLTMSWRPWIITTNQQVWLLTFSCLSDLNDELNFASFDNEDSIFITHPFWLFKNLQIFSRLRSLQFD